MLLLISKEWHARCCAGLSTSSQGLCPGQDCRVGKPPEARGGCSCPQSCPCHPWGHGWGQSAPSAHSRVPRGEPAGAELSRVWGSGRTQGGLGSAAENGESQRGQRGGKMGPGAGARELSPAKARGPAAARLGQGFNPLYMSRLGTAWLEYRSPTSIVGLLKRKPSKSVITCGS